MTTTSTITDEAVAEIAGRMFDGDLVRQPQRVQDRVWRDARAALEAALPCIATPTRDQILSAMIAAIYEDGDVATVRQGLPSAEWNLLSIAADAVVDLLGGSRDPQA